MKAREREKVAMIITSRLHSVIIEGSGPKTTPPPTHTQREKTIERRYISFSGGRWSLCNGEGGEEKQEVSEIW